MSLLMDFILAKVGVVSYPGADLAQDNWDESDFRERFEHLFDHQPSFDGRNTPVIVLVTRDKYLVVSSMDDIINYKFTSNIYDTLEIPKELWEELLTTLEEGKVEVVGQSEDVEVSPQREIVSVVDPD